VLVTDISALVIVVPAEVIFAADWYLRG